MSKLFLIAILFLIISVNGYSQLPYSWVPGVDPGWVSSGDGNGDLSWNNLCLVVTTNCGGTYNDNENSFYTSNTIDASCSNASTIMITFSASGNAEFGWDFLFVEYSLDNGITWINPYGPGVGWTGNFGVGTTIPPIIVPTSSTFKFRFNFQSDFIFSYSGYKIIDFDILCNVALPILLVDFYVRKEGDKNVLKWITSSEINNNYFTIFRSVDGYNFELISNIDAVGTSNNQVTYTFVDYDFKKVVNYYKLTQTDYNGLETEYNIVVVDNSIKHNHKLVRVVNAFGQEIDVNKEICGELSQFRILIYDDGSVVKKVGK